MRFGVFCSVPEGVDLTSTLPFHHRHLAAKSPPPRTRFSAAWGGAPGPPSSRCPHACSRAGGTRLPAVSGTLRGRDFRRSPQGAVGANMVGKPRGKFGVLWRRTGKREERFLSCVSAVKIAFLDRSCSHKVSGRCQPGLGHLGLGEVSEKLASSPSLGFPLHLDAEFGPF